MVLGPRRIGKSFDIKADGLDIAFNTGEPVALIRRWSMDYDKGGALKYFGDITSSDIEEITCNQFNELDARAGEYRFIYRNEAGIIERRSHTVGYYLALTESAHIKSNAYKKCNRVIFEEFITETYYLPDEEDKLWSVVSTLGRGEFIPLYLIGNQITRASIYFRQWNLSGIPRQKQGSIEHYEIYVPYDSTYRTLAVELCAQRDPEGKDTKYRRSKDTKHHWQTHATARESEVLKVLRNPIVYLGNMAYLLTFKIYKGHNKGIFITPKTTTIQEGTTVVCKDSTLLNSDYRCSIGFRSLRPRDLERLKLHKDLIYFSDPLTAEDWRSEGITF